MAELFQPSSLSRVRTSALEVFYLDAGPIDGEVTMLLHGFPYDVFSFTEVVPILTALGKRVIVPYLRGHGPTRALGEEGLSGQQAAIGTDVIELMDALGVERSVLAGFDWGARAACVAAALWPERCTGLVSVSGYLIQDIARSDVPIAPEIEAGLWYFYYFATERGRRGLAANSREIARVIWTRNSPRWRFSEAELQRVAETFDSPDYVDVVIHSYRHRLGLAAGFEHYQNTESRLVGSPEISVPTVTLDGTADGNFPATDGSGYATHLTGPHRHHQIAGAGHNLPRESPQAFADAIVEVSALSAGER